MARRRRLVLEPLETRLLLNAGPVQISEFMADNGSTLADEDGMFSDWIELHNQGDMPIDLDGWYLTDDASNPIKWRFPDVSLEADARRLVFASGKDRTDPASALHTNFRLSADGEYLGLIEPDGFTVAHAFAPAFPEQHEDLSYGSDRLIVDEPLIEPGDAARLFLPTDNSLGQTWIDPTFNDSGWTSGTTGVGFDVEVGDYYHEVRSDEPIAYWRLSESTGSVTNSAIGSDGFDEGEDSAIDGTSIGFGGVGSERATAGLLSAVADTAARFDGLDDVVLIPDNSAIGNNTNTTRLRTIELWFSADTVPGPTSTDHQVLWEDGGRVNGLNVYLYQGEIYFGAWVNNAGNWISHPIDSATTYHAVMTYDAVTDELFGYLNGQRIDEAITTNLPGIAAHSGDNAIGGVQQDTRFEDSSLAGNGVYFDGVIDEVALYNRVLSGDRVARHYRSAMEGIPMPRLIAYWPFDATSDSGAIAPDVVGNYNATIVGATLTSGGMGHSGEALSFDGENDYVDAGIVDEMIAPRAFTLSTWFKRTQDRIGDSTNHNIDNVLIAQSSLAANDHFELGTSGSTVEVYLHTDEKEGPDPSLQKDVGVVDNTWHHVAITYDKDRSDEVKLYTDGSLVGTYADWGGRLASSDTSPWVIGMSRPHDQAWGGFDGLIDEVAVWDGSLDAIQIAALSGGGSPADITGFHDLLGTDIEESLHEIGTSAYVRIPFQVDRDPVDFDFLAFDVKYDDALVVWLNGQEVVRRNVPISTGFDSAALAQRPDGEAVAYEAFDLTGSLDLLVEGENVLAVHLLNASAVDPDLLLLPKLTGQIDFGVADRYFSVPTPGESNDKSFAGFVGDTRFSIDRGYYDTPFQVEISTKTPGASIRYTTDGSPPRATTGLLYSGPIDVTTTTVLRAAAFKPGYRPSDVDTQTYVFLNDVITQPASPSGFPAQWGSVPADYAMDPDITTDPRFVDSVRPSLESLPTMSLVMDPPDLWDTATGIYANTQEVGSAWERPVSVELFGFPETSDAQVDAGIRMQGNASRSTTRPKHNMRLVFRSEYGPSLLEFPLFGETEVQRFNHVVLRGGNGDSWIHPNSSQRTQGQYIRDQWHRDAQLAMGQPTSQQSYAQLYINGLYWGVYHLIERPESEFMAEHFGGDSEDYDVIQHRNETLDGDRVAWDAMMTIVRSGNLDQDAVYQQVLETLDPVSLIDFMLLNFYSNNTDWDHNNWYGGRKRESGATWKFFSWDAERTFVSTTGNITGILKTNQPSEVHQALCANAEYRMLVADRIQRHFFNDGPLTPEGAEALWQARIDELELPLVAESARWGDHHRATDPYTPLDEWAGEFDRLTNSFFPTRTDTVLAQLKARALYPDVDAPWFNVNGTTQHGGLVQPGDGLSIHASSGTIYYTTDGTDPRLEGGLVSPAAQTFDGTDVPLGEMTLVKARVWQADEWSALNEATFSSGRPVVEGDLVVTEIHYHPHDSTLVQGDLEFLELQSVAEETLDLSGLRFVTGIQFDLATAADRLLEPGDYLLIAADAVALENARGPGLSIAGSYSGTLDNGGEDILAVDALGTRVLGFRYGDSGAWPGRADGGGSSLQVKDRMADPNDSSNWRSSSLFCGSPGAEGLGPFVDLVVNEVLTHTDPPESDSIELFNTTDHTIDIGGWYLSDTNSDYRGYSIPIGTLVPAGGYVVFDETDFNLSGGIDPNDFALDSAHGDDVWFLAADASDRLTRFVDHVSFGAMANGESIGRWPNGSGELTPSLAVTLGAVNSPPRVGPIVFSEIHYNPSDAVGASDLEFIELLNPTSLPIDLTEWRLRKGVDYDFAPGTTLAARSLLVVVPFDPLDLADADKLTAFYQTYSIDASVTMVGPYSGQLDGGGETVRLQRPDEPPADEPEFIPRLLEDEVDYNDTIPWPVEADGGGASLNRISPAMWGNDPTGWVADTPSPGNFQPRWSLDVDNNGRADALSDGLLVLRHLFGFSDASLTSGALGSDATRTDPAEIASFLESCRAHILDIDANGASDALSDGIMILRYLFGFNGVQLVSGVLSDDAYRTDPEQISEFLNRCEPLESTVNQPAPSPLPANLVEPSTLVLNEFLASNGVGLVDSDGRHSDWIEIYNPTSGAIDLDGWYLTDSPSDLEKWQFPAITVPADGYLVVFATGQDRTDPAGELHTNFQLSTGGEYLALIEPDGLTVAHSFEPAYPSQFSDMSYGLLNRPNTFQEILVDQFASTRALVPMDDSLGFTWTEPGFDDSAWQAGSTGVGYDTGATYDALLNLDVQTPMYNSRGGVYVRIPFEVSDPTQLNALVLRMKYDDGFVAYLNGYPIADANAPVDPTAADLAAADHPDTQATVFEEFDVSEHLGRLHSGANVLAIHGMNIRANSSDLLILPQLITAGGEGEQVSVGAYFITPTPGEPNRAGVDIPGPLVRRLTETPSSPGDLDDLVITAEVEPTVASLADVSLHWRVMYESESTTTMRDDGVGPDVTAGDGLFTAVIPHTASDGGEMVRWYVTASDVSSGTSRFPAFLDPVDSPEYCGTIVENTSIESLMPVLHWFVEDPSAANTRTGTRSSVYYAGEFYDNIKVDLHGQSTSGFPKKSYDFDFNRGDRFRYADDQRRVKDFNLLTNWADKSNLRNTMAYETFADAGSPYHVAFAIRVEQNGQFFSTADWVEDGDDRFLDRLGLDPDGALYKVYDRLDNVNRSEKKSRKWEDKSDLQSLIDGLLLTGDDLKGFLYDNIDLPEVVNFLASTVIISNTDMGHKNYYVYRDSDGTGLWQVLPWDVDLSFGHCWTSSRHYWDDTMYTDTGLFVVHSNRLMTGLFNTPEIREMYVRRLRTLMDELVQPPGTPVEELHFEARLEELLAQIDPHDDPDPASGTDDADLDYQKWGSWGNQNTMRQALARITDEYLPARRDFLYNQQTVGAGGEIPDAQVEMVTLPLESRNISIGTIEYAPISTNQDEEYIELVNTNAFALDISGWHLREAIEHTFHPGTVIPAGATLYVSPNVVAFRARAEGPSGGQSLFVQGAYEGHLSSFGETIRLEDAAGNEIASKTYLGDPSLAQEYLQITELMYHPQPPNQEEINAGFLDADLFEYVELTNSGPEPLHLDSVHFSEGVDFTFGAITLDPGQFLVVVRDEGAFAARYGTEIDVAGAFLSGGLKNSGETLKLEDAVNGTIRQFEYDDDGVWPSRPDGKGSSLEVIDPSDNLDDADNWRPSSEYGGSPGRAGSGPIVDLVINEVLSHTDLPELDSIELLNVSGTPVAIGGWYLSDSSANYFQFTIPKDVVVGAGEYLVFDENDFNASGGIDVGDFALDSAHGDDVWLLAADSQGKPTRFVDHVSFGAAINGESFGRWPNGVGSLVPVRSTTFGGENSGPRIDPVFVSEIHYNPGTMLDADLLEFVEIHNSSDALVDLTDWRIRGGVDFDFASATLLEPNRALVIVPFDPADPLQANLLSAFRTTYAIEDSVRLVGPYLGQLKNGGERIVLQRPDEPPMDEPTYIPRLVADEFDYEDASPWPTSPDGGGESLNRVAPGQWAGNAISWGAAAPTPGTYQPLVWLDVDGNGVADPLTDGLLILRHLFGFSQSSLVNRVVSPDARRSDPLQITSYLTASESSILDPDGSGDADPLTDGVLILRYLFGFSSTSLTDGVLSPNAQRTDSVDLTEFLDGYCFNQWIGTAPEKSISTVFSPDRQTSGKRAKT